MKQKLLTIKSLLVAVLLLGGANFAWAETVGEGDFSTGYLGATSTIKTITSGGSLHYVFTVSKPTTKNWQNWILYIGTTGESVSWANGLAIVRGDNWEDKWATSSTENGSDAGCWNDFVWGDWDAVNECHPTYCEFMNGATVDMTVTYECGKLNMVATVTKDATTKNYKFYKFLDGAPDAVDACLSVNGASLDITTADYTPSEPYYNVTRYLQDFANESTVNNGWTYGSNTTGSQTYIGGKALYINVNNAGGGRAANLNLSGQSAYFASVSDYCFEFDFNSAYATDAAHETTTTLVSSEGTVFYMKNKNSSTTTIYNVSDEVIGTITNSGYNTKPTTTYHFIVKSSSTGTTLTVTQNGRTVMDETAVNASLVHLTALNNSLGRSYNHAIFDNILLREHSAVETVTDPTIEITGVSGANREVTITSGTSSKGNEVTTYYTTDGSDPTSASTAYSAPITIESDCTVKAISISSGGESGIASLAITTGAITLNTPTWTKTGYSAGVSTVTLADNQSDILLNPATTIKYKIDDNDAQTYSSAISVNDGETLKYWAEAAGYTQSAYGSVTAVAPNSIPTLWTESYAASADKQTITRDGDAVMTVNTTDYFYMTAATDGRISNRLLTSTADGTSNWLYRTGGIYGGALQGYAITGVKSGDYVVITYSRGDGDPVPNATDGSKDEWNSTSTSMGINVTGSTGVLRFSIARYGYIKSITVYGAPVSVTVSAAGYATYVNNDNDLDFSASSIEAYKVQVTAKGVATMTQVDNVPAGTPVLLYKDGGATEDIPVMTGATAVSGNDLVAGTGAAVATTDGDYTNMILNNGTSGIGFYLANDQTVATNRAYLHFATTLLPNPAAPMMLVFDNETTGINGVRSKMEDVRGEVYDLQGRQVAQPTKGLYIVNGKKVVIK